MRVEGGGPREEERERGREGETEREGKKLGVKYEAGSRKNIVDSREYDDNAGSELTNPAFLNLRFRHTRDIIKAINEGTFPKQAMLNFHPQRWNDALVPWVKELVWQNVKNQGKRVLIAVKR